MNNRKTKAHPVNIPVKLKRTMKRPEDDLSTRTLSAQVYKHPIPEIEDYRTIGIEKVHKFVVSRG